MLLAFFACLNGTEVSELWSNHGPRIVTNRY